MNLTLRDPSAGHWRVGRIPEKHLIVDRASMARSWAANWVRVAASRESHPFDSAVNLSSVYPPCTSVRRLLRF